jgi:hypothetical protein
MALKRASLSRSASSTDRRSVMSSEAAANRLRPATPGIGLTVAENHRCPSARSTGCSNVIGRPRRSTRRSRSTVCAGGERPSSSFDVRPSTLSCPKSAAMLRFAIT